MAEVVGLGYDAGGNKRHGVAMVCGDPPRLDVANCLETAAEAREWLRERIQDLDGPVALGADTLTAWSLDRSGDRHADVWLRKRYAGKRNSVIHPNSLFSAMTVNGMGVLMGLSESHPDLPITEVHPGVLEFALAETEHRTHLDALRGAVPEHVGKPADQAHARDAAVCAYAAWNVAQGRWTDDLHAGAEGLVSPLREPRFYWPPLTA